MVVRTTKLTIIQLLISLRFTHTRLCKCKLYRYSLVPRSRSRTCRSMKSPSKQSKKTPLVKNPHTVIHDLNIVLRHKVTWQNLQQNFVGWLGFLVTKSSFVHIVFGVQHKNDACKIVLNIAYACRTPRQTQPKLCVNICTRGTSRMAKRVIRPGPDSLAKLGAWSDRRRLTPGVAEHPIQRESRPAPRLLSFAADGAGAGGRELTINGSGGVWWREWQRWLRGGRAQLRQEVA